MCPSVDAASKIEHLGVAAREEIRCDLATSTASVAHDDDGTVARNLAETLRYLAQRDPLGFLEARHGNLVRLADIEQYDLRGAIRPSAHELEGIQLSNLQTGLVTRRTVPPPPS